MVSVETLILGRVLVVFVRRERYVRNLQRFRAGRGEDESLLLFSFMRLSFAFSPIASSFGSPDSNQSQSLSGHGLNTPKTDSDSVRSFV